ncbi:TRAP transporter small permease [Szabonella alba]|uniref:TRAP transporter small permease protein n=1 Tax=Szabonella alba TaxID=2804194 RepID=A0A8K0V7F0_9RHOB|nr:TRAP transporter small permease [Szabonella alba]MBL4916852.1 TRAP transporter small permease [Szabonella alba]
MLTRIESGWARILELSAMAMMMGMVGVIAWSVIGRQVFRLPVAWSEEVGAGLMAWMVLTGSAAAWHQRRHLMIDLVLRRLNRRWLAVFCAVIEALSVLLFAVAFWGALSMMEVSANNSTTALGISFRWLYLALVVGLGSMIAFSLIFLFRLFTGDRSVLPDYATEAEWNT